MLLRVVPEEGQDVLPEDSTAVGEGVAFTDIAFEPSCYGLAYAFPYRRFAALAGVRARLRIDADRYSLIVSDFHRLLLAGLPGALRKILDTTDSAISVSLDRT